MSFKVAMFLVSSSDGFQLHETMTGPQLSCSNGLVQKLCVLQKKQCCIALSWKMISKEEENMDLRLFYQCYWIWIVQKKIRIPKMSSRKHLCQSLGPRDKDQKPLEVPWAAVSLVSSRHVGYPIAKTPVLKCVRSICCWTNNQQLGCQNCWVLECPGRRLVAWG